MNLLTFNFLTLKFNMVLHLSLRGSRREPKFRPLIENPRVAGQSQEKFRTGCGITGDCHALRARNDNNPHLFSLCILLFPFFLPAQDNYVFGPNVKVNDDPGGQAYHNVYSSGGHAIAARGDTVYLAYRGDHTGSSNIYFSKSTDCGQTWTPGLRVNFPIASIIQSLAVDSRGDIFITYTHMGGQRDIHFTKSTDGGLSFSNPIRVNDDTTSVQQGPTIAVDTSGQRVFVAWMDARNSGSSSYDIYFSRSTNGGLTFEPNIRVDDTGNDPAWQTDAGLAVDRGGNNVYTTWQDERNVSSNGSDVYFARSTDGGVSFLPNVLVNDTATTGSSHQWQPTIAIDTLGRIFIAWNDERAGNEGCFCARSDDGGLSFGNNVKATDVDDVIIHSSIAVDDSDGVYVVWGNDDRVPPLGNDRIFFAFSPTAGDSFLANVQVDDLPAGEQYWLWNPTLAINKDKKVFIAWQDDRLNPTNAFDIYFALGTYVGIQELATSGVVRDFIEIVPNLFQHYLTVKSLGGDINQITLFDVLGRQIKNIENKNKKFIKLEVRDLSAGIYFVKVKTEGKTFVKKIVKIE